jgi:hypothetical protein
MSFIASAILGVGGGGLSAAILGGGALAAGGSIASGLIGANAANTAASDQLQAAQLAQQTQLGIFNQTQSNLAPYNTAGQSALSQLAKLFGLGPGGTGPNASTAAAATSALQNYPGYQFGLQQGNLAQQQSAASQGLLLSGSQLQAAQTFGQNYAMQNAWNPYVSSLSSIANLGENAAATTGQIGANTGAGVASSQLAAGTAAASGAVGSANAITSGLTSATGTAANSGLMYAVLANAQNGSSYVAPTSAAGNPVQFAPYGNGNYYPMYT